jgi:NAD(P)-dependent dehydrogenase (short-subunit alcohol dehydrogenase family)
MHMKLTGRNALITGASQGLGKVIAEHFVRAGASVAICARDAELLSRTRAELESLATSGQRVLAMPCDVSSEEQVGNFVADAAGELGSLHTLVTNAGIYGPLGPTESVDLGEWTRAIEINLYGVLLPCRAVLPHFKRAGAGKIVMISGGGATNPLPNISAYAASKAAVVRLMETLAEEWKQYRVDINAVAPGALKTRMMDQVLKAGPEAVGPAFYAKNVKWVEGGATPPSLCADLCVYLASSESDGVTGRLISAQWDPWSKLHTYKDDFGDIYTLRRIVPEDRGKKWE